MKVQAVRGRVVDWTLNGSEAWRMWSVTKCDLAGRVLTKEERRLRYLMENRLNGVRWWAEFRRLNPEWRASKS